MADEQMFKEAVDAIRQGQRARAKDLLTRLLRTNQNNAQYWIYLSTVVDTDKERKYCLKNALKIDPQNAAAQRGMVMLGFSPVAETQSYVHPAREREWDVSEVLSITGEARQTTQTEVKIPWTSLTGVFLLGSVVIALMLIGVFGNPAYEEPPIRYIDLRNTSTPVPLGYNNTTATAQALDPESTAIVVASTRVFDGTITATFTGPTPLSSILDAPYTPTPQYVVTPHTGNDDFTFGMQNFERKDWAQAISYFERFIKAEPEHADARYYLGLAYYQTDEYLEAKNAFNGAINLDETLGPAYLARAQTSIALRQTGLIIDDLNFAVKYASDWAEVFLVRADYRLTGVLNPEGALADAESALELEPENARAYYYIAQVHLFNEDYEKALAAAETTRDLDRTLVDNYFILSKVLIETGQTDQALGYIQTFLTYNPENAEAQLIFAQVQVSLEEYDNAILTLETVEDLDNTLYEVNYYRGLAELALEDYKNATASLNNAVRIFPKWFEPKLALGQTIFLSGDTGNGYTAIHASASLAKTDEHLVQLYYWRALSLEALDLFDQANNDWVRLLELPSEVVPEAWATRANSHIKGLYEVTPTPNSTAEAAAATPTP